jgi:hypothetical protein
LVFASTRAMYEIVKFARYLVLLLFVGPWIVSCDVDPYNIVPYPLHIEPVDDQQPIRITDEFRLHCAMTGDLTPSHVLDIGCQRFVQRLKQKTGLHRVIETPSTDPISVQLSVKVSKPASRLTFKQVT